MLPTYEEVIKVSFFNSVFLPTDTKFLHLLMHEFANFKVENYNSLSVTITLNVKLNHLYFSSVLVYKYWQGPLMLIIVFFH